MDCRRTLGLGLCLLIGAAGCTRQEAAVPVVTPAQAAKAAAPPPVVNVPPGAVVKKASDLPKRPPHAATCVAFGDFAAREAEAPNLSDTERQAKREQARKAYEQAIALDSKCLPAYLSLAQLYAAMKDHAHAEATYRKASQTFPTEARVFFEMGRCCGGEQKWDEAVKALARAVELDPENRPYVDTLGWMQARAGRFDESFATFRKVYDEPEAHYRLALMLDHMNQTDQCRKHLTAALNQDPRMERAKALLAKLDGPSAGPVQQTAYTESANPPDLPAATPAGPPGPPPTADPAPAPPAPAPPAPVAASGGLRPPLAPGAKLPPPPHIPIRYQDAPPLPASVGPNG